MGVESIIVCKHGNLGYSASLRFTDSSKDCELSHDDKVKLYKMINYTVRASHEVLPASTDRVRNYNVSE